MRYTIAVYILFLKTKYMNIYKFICISIFPLITHILFYWIPCMFFYFFDRYYEAKKKLSIVKTQPKYIDNIKNSINWNMYYGAIKQSLFNQFVVALPLCITVAPLYMFINDNDLDNLNLYELIRDLIYFILLIEIMFYYAHRLLHVPIFYKYIHAKHHKWKHPFAPSAIDVHYLEYIFAFLLPYFIYFIVVCPHLLTYCIAIMLGSINIVKAHSGYDIPFFSSKYHDIHHKEKRYNFGFLDIMDYLHGTLKY